MLWIFPAGADFLTVDSRFIHPCQHSVTQFPCVAFNAANSRFPPVRHSNPLRVPSFPTSAAIGYLQVLLFGLAPWALPGTENRFWCFKTKRLDCARHLETLQHTVFSSLSRCLRPMGRRLCGRELSQLCLALAPEQHVDLIVLGSTVACSTFPRFMLFLLCVQQLHSALLARVAAHTTQFWRNIWVLKGCGGFSRAWAASCLQLALETAIPTTEPRVIRSSCARHSFLFYTCFLRKTICARSFPP